MVGAQPPGVFFELGTTCTVVVHLPDDRDSRPREPVSFDDSNEQDSFTLTVVPILAMNNARKPGGACGDHHRVFRDFRGEHEGKYYLLYSTSEEPFS